jgi:DNA repair exonuclease SbcCD ATPase subunit
MKINNLELKNFRNHERSFLLFDRVNFIFGKNNQGKSTVKLGLEYALTGKNEYVTNAASAKEQIRCGTPEAFVEAELEEMGTIKRTITPKGTDVELNSNKLPDREVLKEIEDIYGISYEPLNCIINGSKFLSMKPNEQKDFLFKLMGINFTASQIVSFMANPTNEAKKKVEDSLTKAPVSIEDLDNLYKDFYASRKVAKKELENVKAKTTALGPVPDDSGVDIGKINVEKAKVEKKREDVLGKIAVINERKRQKDRLEKEIQRIKDELEKVTSQIDKSVNVADAEETIFCYVTDINRHQQEKEKSSVALNVLKRQTESLKNMLGKLNTPICPLSDKLVCKTDKTVLTNDLELQIRKNEKEIKSHETNVEEHTKNINELNTKKDHLERQVGLYVKMDDLNERLKEVSAQHTGIVVQDKLALEAENEELQKKLADLNAAVEAHKKWIDAKKIQDELSREFTKAADEVALYEYLVEEFSPKGVKSRILQKVIQPVQDHCNKTFETLTNGEYKLEFDFSKGFDIIVTNPNGTVPVRNLSNSDKLRIGIVFQDAISTVTNAKLMFIDNAEILDEDNLKLLVELIKKIQDRYDSIFVIATYEDQNKCKKVGSSASNSKVFYVQEGKVTEL